MEVYEAFEGAPGFVGCIVKELIPLTTEEHTLALAAPLGTTLSEASAGKDTTPSSKDPQRSSIFSTFTRIRTSIIKILIDSGSVVNADAAASVHTLGLQPLSHPRPYRAMWIKDASLAVTKRCLVPLHVAGYREEVWCDILPMGVGSVLLGQPWLYNRDVAQYGRTNHYVFYFGGNKQIWQPSVPQDQIKAVQAKAPIIQNPLVQLLGIVSARQFLKGVENDAPIWAIQV